MWLYLLHVLSIFLNFSIIFGLFTIFLIISGSFPGIVYLAIFPVLLVQILFAVGLGITLGVLNVFFRDVGQFFGVVLQFWFWLTPVVYPRNILPESLNDALRYNPMTNIITAYQKILVNGQWPDWSSLWPVSMIAILLCFWGMHLFRKHAGEMVDEL